MSRNVFYGWILCGLGALCITALTAVMYSFGVFFEPLGTGLGASDGLISAVFAANQFMTYLFAGAIGFSADNRDVRHLVGFGTLCAVGGLLGTAAVPTFAGFVLFYGVVLAVGFGTVYVAIYAAIARWFRERRGLAMSILSVGFGVGALVGPPAADLLLQHLTWTDGYLAFAVPLGGLFGLATVLFRNEPAAIGAHPDGAPAPPEMRSGATNSSDRLAVRDALANREFWLLSVGFLLSSYGFYALIVHFVPYVTSLGHSGTVAAGALGMIGGASVPARFGAGFASDYVGRKAILVASILVMGVALFGIVLTSNALVITALVVVFGVGFGGQNGLYSPLVADVFAVSNVGRMIGLTSVAFAVSGAAGPVASSALYALTGAYVVPFLVAGVFTVVGAGLISLSRPETPAV